MEQYIYTVKDEHGRPRTGVIEASDKRQASTMLHDKGMIVIRLEEKKPARDVLSLVRNFKGIGLGQLTNFTRQLSIMVNSGLSLTDALTILEKQTPDPSLKEVISSVTKDVQGGANFANALAKHKKVFSPAYTNMIKSGEASGTLDQVLNKLADALEKDREFKGKIEGAFIYPVIVVVAMMIVAFIVLVFVIPKLTSLYEDLGAQLPLPTKILLILSGILRNFWWLVIGGTFGGIFFLRRYRKTDIGGRQIDGLILKLPVMGKINSNTSLAVFTRTLGSLVGSGVPILEALKISGEVSSNALHKDSIKRATQSVEKGALLSAALTKDPLFPPIVSQMVSVGEETGKLDEVLTKLSRYFEGEVEQDIKGLTAALEPIIMIILGVMVAFLVISIILPIYKITSSL